MSATQIRKNFEFDKRYIELMTRLKDVCGLKTETSVIEEALVLLAWAADEVASNRKIGAYDENTQSLNQITTPALEKARHWHQSAVA